MKRYFLPILVLLFIGIGLSLWGPADTPASAQDEITISRQNAITDVIQETGSSVARIEVTRQVAVQDPFSRFFQDETFERYFRFFFGDPAPFDERERQISALGSGFVIQFGGRKYVLTNQHVVADADKITVIFPNGKRYDAEVIGSDADVDLAVLELRQGLFGASLDNLPTALSLGDSDGAIIGEWAIAIGNPEGLFSTVTVGVVSALHRDIPKPNGNGLYRDMIQTDAAINPGNSGGPLVNAHAEVIGINAAIQRAGDRGIPLEGLNFAISINSAKQILPQLIETGRVRRAWLGVFIQVVTPQLAEEFNVEPERGTLVSDVVGGSPSDGKLERGDVILKVDGNLIQGPSGLQDEIMFRQVGEQVTLEVIRDGQQIEVNVTLGERPETSALAPRGVAPVPKFGVTVTENSRDLAERMDLATDEGMAIIDVESGSKAFWAGLQPGDVILEVDRRPVNSVEEWNEIVGGISEDENPVFTIMRGDRTRFMPLR
ncbi:MAG: trypsin-like peptidase domain-containing protein [Candidatus Bipolaricaulia bacterium]